MVAAGVLDDTLLQVACASACVEADDLDGARAAIAPVLDRPPGDPEETNLVGLLHFATGNVDRAREVYLRGLARWGDWAALLFNVAVCDVKLGRLQEARGYLERLVRIRPRHRRAWTCLGLVYSRMDEPHLARAAFARASDAVLHRDRDAATTQRPRAPDLFVTPPLEAEEPGEAAADALDGTADLSRALEGAAAGRDGYDAYDAYDDGADTDGVAGVTAVPDAAERPTAPAASLSPSLEPQLAFVPRTIPASAPVPMSRAALPNVVTAAMAAAAGFSLVFALDRQPPARPPVMAPLTWAHSTSGKLPEVRPTANVDAQPPPVEPAAPSLSPQPAPTEGVLRTPESMRGHRVFVDGRLRCGSGDPVKLPCGPHQVQVGSAGRKQHVVVPCGGEIDVER